MTTKAQTEADFRAELSALLKRYDAELSADDHYTGYPECGEDIRMTVTIPARYSCDGETLMEYTEIDLGRFQPFGKPA